MSDTTTNYDSEVTHDEISELAGDLRRAYGRLGRSAYESPVSGKNVSKTTAAATDLRRMVGIDAPLNSATLDFFARFEAIANETKDGETANVATGLRSAHDKAALAERFETATGAAYTGSLGGIMYEAIAYLALTHDGLEAAHTAHSPDSVACYLADYMEKFEADSDDEENDEE